MGPGDWAGDTELPPDEGIVLVITVSLELSEQFCFFFSSGDLS